MFACVVVDAIQSMRADVEKEGELDREDEIFRKMKLGCLMEKEG